MEDPYRRRKWQPTPSIARRIPWTEDWRDTVTGRKSQTRLSMFQYIEFFQSASSPNDYGNIFVVQMGVMWECDFLKGLDGGQ